MKTITVHIEPGKIPEVTAQETAIAHGFNCYSKPAGNNYWDCLFDDRQVFYYKWKGEILEVTVLNTPAPPPCQEKPQITAMPGSETLPSNTITRKPAPQMALKLA